MQQLRIKKQKNKNKENIYNDGVFESVINFFQNFENRVFRTYQYDLIIKNKKKSEVLGASIMFS